MLVLYLTCFDLDLYEVCVRHVEVPRDVNLYQAFCGAKWDGGGLLHIAIWGL